MKDRGIRLKTSDWKEDVKKQIEKFKPDLIAMSTTEDMWELGVRILNEVKEYKIKNNVPVIAGGVFPTFAPEIVSEEKLIDIVCVGEGENALIDLCEKIQNKEDYLDPWEEKFIRCFRLKLIEAAHLPVLFVIHLINKIYTKNILEKAISEKKV